MSLSINGPTGSTILSVGGEAPAPLLQEVPPPTSVATVTQVAAQPDQTPDVVQWNDVQGKPAFGTASLRDVPAVGDAAPTQVVLGDDSRLTGERPTNSNLISDATVVGKALLTAPTQVQARGTLGISSVGDALFTAATPLDGRNTLGLGTVATLNTGPTGAQLVAASTPAAARGILNAGVTGDALFLAATAGAARTTLGASASGDSVFTGTPAQGRTALGATTIGGGIFTAADVAAVLALLSVPAQPTFRNKLLNAAMNVLQFSGTITATGSQYIIDNWLSNVAGGSFSAAVVNAAGLAGFPSFLRFTSTAANAVVAGSVWNLMTYVEGVNTVELEFGTARAQPIAVSFWVRSSIAGLYAASISNLSVARSYVASFTINTANTWEYKSFTVPGDVTGTWNTSNSVGFRLRICVGTGSTFATASANAWVNGDFSGLVGQVNLPATNGATFDLTGVQLEAGTYATPFERRLYAAELAMLQRYFEAGNFYLRGYAIGADDLSVALPFKVTKRVAPTLTYGLSVSNNTSTADVRNPTNTDLRVYAIAAATGMVDMDGNYVADARL